MGCVSGRDQSRTVCVCGDHVPSALCHCPAVLFCRALEPAVRPACVSIKREHLLHVLKHVIKEFSTKGALEVSLVPVLGLLMGLLVGLEVAVKGPLVMGVLVMTEQVRVSEQVIKVEVKVLVEVLSTPATACAWLTRGGAMSKLVILQSPLIV